MSGFRLAEGGLVDRAQPVSFRWGGRSLTGFAGDTLASASLANGVEIVARSFKYHRPRGLMGAGFDEPNAIVQLGEGTSTIPNRKATEVELYGDLVASAVNAWPSPEFDLMSVSAFLKPFIPAAFYYKSFMWPSWRLFEPTIRRAAGLGRAPDRADPDIYDHQHAQVPLLIVGGGVAGLESALETARRGVEVMLVEAEPLLGGQLVTGQQVDGMPARAWVVDAVAELERLGARLLTRTTAVGFHDHGFLTLAERLTDHLPERVRRGPRQRLWKVRAADVVLATGALERPLVFAGNDLPGVMLASAAAVYHERFAVAPGRRIVLATNNDSGWIPVLALARAGVEIAAILDARDAPDIGLLAQAAALGIEVHAGCSVQRAIGWRRLRAVRPVRLDAEGRGHEAMAQIACDSLLLSGGFNPTAHLHSQSGGPLEWDDTLAAFVPGAHPQGCRSIGAASGASLPDVRPLWQVSADPASPPADAWVDFQNDVTAADIALAHREAFRSVEHLKRYTTLGMASDQGKTSNINGLAIMGQLMGKSPQAVGTTRFRPPYDPTTIGAYAAHRTGALLKPLRLLPADASHRALGAAMEAYGGWLRPACYPRGGEDEAAVVAREASAVRTCAGLFDASPLGKIEVKGPDAVRFLDRICVGTISTLKPGRCRYSLMLDEHGIVFDDGIVARLSRDHFLVGTTSGHAAAVAANLQEWLQCEWTDLAVATMDVTPCWAVMNLAGPLARRILADLETDIDLSRDAFPHLSHREGQLEGVHCRIQRVSFSGELSFEIAVPASFGAGLHDRLMQAGAPHGLTPFGIEALMTLRIEKGFLHIGSDTDGMTLPQDIGFGGPVSSKASDFVGRRSCLRPDALRVDRRQFVGLESADGALLPVGGHVIAAGGQVPAGSEGWVTSAANSPVLGRPHALAMVAGGRSRLGELVEVWDLGRRHRARIVEPCAFDPGGERMNG